MKKIIITGAAGNLGMAVIKTFIEGGYYVIATVSHGNMVGDYDGHQNLEVHAIDAMDENGVKVFIETIMAKHNRIDGALLLIGGFATGSVLDSNGNDLQKMFNLNFNTAYNFARPVYKQMTEQSSGGKIIFVGSVPAIDEKAGFDMLPYTLAKNAVVKLAKILNSSKQHKNIQCSVIVPTTIDTPQNRLAMPDADFAKWTTATEIAKMMEFICSDNGNKFKDLVVKM